LLASQFLYIYKLFTDGLLKNNDAIGTLNEEALIKPQVSSSLVDTIVSGKRFPPVKNAMTQSVVPDESQTKFAEETPEQNNSLGNGLNSNVSSDTSLSVERKAECLDLQSLVKDLETQNQKLSEENEKLLNKLSVQSKVQNNKFC